MRMPFECVNETSSLEIAPRKHMVLLNISHIGLYHKQRFARSSQTIIFIILIFSTHSVPQSVSPEMLQLFVWICNFFCFVFSIHLVSIEMTKAVAFPVEMTIKQLWFHNSLSSENQCTSWNKLWLCLRYIFFSLMIDCFIERGREGKEGENKVRIIIKIKHQNIVCITSQLQRIRLYIPICNHAWQISEHHSLFKTHKHFVMYQCTNVHFAIMAK